MSVGDFPDSCLSCGRYPADSHLTIACHLLVSRAKRVDCALVRQNVRVRKVLIGVLATIIAVVVGAVGADFGAAIYAEYRLARSVRTAAHLGYDPWASILGFPFITQAVDRHYNEIEIRATGVDHPVVGK